MQLNNSQFLANSSNNNFIYKEIEVAIRSSLTVDDCVVIERQTQKRKHELVAYVVPSGLFAPEQLLFHLQTILPSELMPTALVPVSTIPLTGTGQLDKAALANLEVIEFNLMRRIEEQLESLSEIERVKVVVEPFVRSVPPVHLEDLLDETQAMPPVTSLKIAPEHSQQNIQANTFSQKIENKNPSLSKKLAISHGEPLQYSKEASKTLQEVLQRTAQNSTKGIIYIQSDGSKKVQSYRELWQDAQRILAGLRKLGLKPQDKVIFQLEDNQDFICAFWGCVLGGFVPVPVSIAPSYEPVNSTASKLQNAWQMLVKPIVLTSASLAPNIDGFFRLLNLENFQIATIDHLRECEPDFKLHQSQPEDLAILLLTCGSTGIPKCVMLNHHNILSMTVRLVSMAYFSSQESVLNWMPLDRVDALVSLSIMAVSLGCQQIHVTTDLIVQNPLKWLDLIDKHQATISCAPNFAFSLICDALGDVFYGTLRERYQAFDIERQKWDFSSMKFIINAGEPIVTKTAGEALLPKALVPVSGIPLTATGEVDELALMNIPVIDESLIGRVEKQLNYHHEIEQAVVVVQELRKKILPLHLSDLIPGWQHQNASANLTPLPKDSQSNTQQHFSESKPLAISHGDILRSDRNAPITLPEVLQKAAQQVASGEIIYLLPDGTELRQSYAKLLEIAERILTGLRKLGLKPKNKVILQIELSCDIIPAFWGCLLGGFVPVIMEVPPTYRELNNVVDKLCHIWQFLDSPVILTTEALKQEVELLSQWLPTERLNIGTIEVLKCNPVSKQYHHSQPDEVALFNLTSGSTGIPKCVQLTHKNLIVRTRGANQLNQHEREDVILNWLPFDHIGSISDWHIRGVVLGCTLVYAQKEYILGRIFNWLDLIHKYRITHSWAPNFAYAIVNDSLKQEPEQTWNLSCVKFLLTAGEAVSSKAVEDFRENLVVYGLKATAIRPAFGMAEMGSGITYYQPIKEAPLLFHKVEKSIFQGTIKRVEIDYPNHHVFTDLGSVIPGIIIRIVDEQNSILREDTIGHLQVKGDAVSPGYYNNHDANSQSFLKYGWFDTGDLGFIANRQLVVTGRAKETIIINGANYYSHEIEAIVEEITEIEVSYTAACAVCNADGATEKLAIFFSSPITEEPKLLELLKKIRQTVVNKIGLNPDYLILLAKEDIPKTVIGKIQRSQLRDRFHAGEFNLILKQFDILLGNTNTIPDWFYQKVWRGKQAKVLKTLSPSGLTIVFLDELGLGTFICQQLEQQNLLYVCVSPGYSFAKKSLSHFCLTPGNADHYQLLLETIKADNLTIGQIIHLWNYQEYSGEIKSIEALEKAQEQGIYSLLFLVQCLAKTQIQDIQLLFVSSYTQSTQTTDKIAYEKSPVLGVIKSIPQEIPWLNCRHIDLTPNSIQVDGNYLLQELQVLSKDQEVAYRNGQRFVAGLEKVNLQGKPKQELPLKSGGMYLISGGLGGVAVEIAKYLIKFFNTKLLLVGRTPLSTTDVASNNSATMSDMIKAYQELKQLGAVVYQTVDICEFQAVQQVVEKAKANWGSQLDGVIHLAGTYHEQMLVDETSQSLAAILRPKVLGAWVLHQVLNKQGQGVFISFSSLASFFGGATISAYAAANNFLESFNQYQRSAGGLQSYCFAWTIWRDTGINKGYQRQEITHAQGYYEMSLQQGLYSFLTGLYYDQAQLIVGLDGSNPKIRRFTSEFPGLQKLTAYFTTNNGSTVPELSDFTVCDRFTTTVNCDFVQLSQMPLTASGEINRDLLARGMTSRAIAPRNEMERQIAQTWQEVLKIPQIGIHDNFFQLGGNSLLAFQVISRLREAFSVELSPNRFFASPTVAGLGESFEALQTVVTKWNVAMDDAEKEYEGGVL